MHKVILTVENTFIKTDTTSNSLGITVYNRVFNKLIYQGGPLGKIHPIYIKIKDRYIIFGVLTLNKTGSYSFFPELPGKYDFDHLTFSANLLKNNHHYTKTTFWKREKVLPISAQLLSTGMYHAASFIYRDLSLLKDVPRHIIYPSVLIDDILQIRDSVMTGNKPDGSSTINMGRNEGSLCIQLFLIPKDINSSKMAPFVEGLSKIQEDINIPNNTILVNTVIHHDYQKNYSLGLLAFLYTGNIDKSLVISTASLIKGFYSKLEVLYLK